MIRFIDKNSSKCARTFYDTLVYYDYMYANQHAVPVDERYVTRSSEPMFYLISHHSFYGESNVPSDLTSHYIRLARRGSVKLLYDFSFEGDWIGIQPFIDKMEELNIPKTAYCILTGADFINGQYPDNVFHCPMFEIKTRFCMAAGLTHKFGITKNKKFLMLNARPRPHRVLLTYLLYENGAINNGHCSLPAENNNIECYNLTETLNVQEKYGIDIDFGLVESLRQELPYRVDDVNYGDSLALNDSPFADIYEHVDFVVVTETLPNTGVGQVFITEKILKAVANKKPFIVLGDQYTLAYMKTLGYKTFDFIIDESYDTMSYAERTKLIAHEVKRLCDVDFNQYRAQLQEVTEHNYNVLMAKDTYTTRIDALVKFLS